MKYQTRFSLKNKKNISISSKKKIKMSSAENFTQIAKHLQN